MVLKSRALFVSASKNHAFTLGEKEEDMIDEREEIEAGERDALAAIGDDALKVFRAGLFLIVIYISILSLTLRTGGTAYIVNIVNSFYTVNGIVFWVGSISVSVLANRMARRTALKNNYSQIGMGHDKFDILNFSTAATVGLLISIFSLIFGLLEGWANTVNDSASGVGIEQPIGIILFSIIFVTSIYTVLSLIDLARNRWGSLREIFRISK